MLFSLYFLFFVKAIHTIPDIPFCGRVSGRNYVEQEKIVGGYDVGYFKYPWYAAFLYEGEVFCGGSLITSRCVITAAHCFKPFIGNLVNENSKLEDVFTVALGANNICKYEETIRKYRIVKVFIQDDYIDNIPYNDIALSFLHREADYFTPVCLPTSVHVGGLNLKEGLVQGFGSIFYTGPESCTLKEARVLIYPEYVCKRMIEDTGNDPDYVEKAFCAGYLSGGVDTCQGDSGGPLLVFGKQGEYVLEGIVSFGFGCAEKNLLGVYTNITEFLPWIFSKLRSVDMPPLPQLEASGTASDTELEKKPHKHRRKIKRKKHRKIINLY